MNTETMEFDPRPPKQPPMVNEHVAPGCEKFPEAEACPVVIFPTVPESEHKAVVAELQAVKEAHATLDALVKQATLDSKAFIQQVDTEGLGMATVTDHRKRVDKFLAIVSKIRGII